MPQKPILHIASKCPIPVNKIQKVWSTYNSLYGHLNGDVFVSFIGESRSKKINEAHTGNAYATDVLTFSFTEQEDSDLIDKHPAGEIYICNPIAKRQAKQLGLSLDYEICLLLVHGIIHLEGRDHQNSSQQASFEKIQSVIMEALGFKYQGMKWLV